MQLLLIAYHFPPIGGAGAQRSAKFARYLPDFGITPVVIAGPAGSPSRWEPEDRTQVREVGDEVTVIRPVDRPMEREDFSRWGRLLGNTTDRERWWRDQIVTLGLEAAETHHVDAIFVSLQPYLGLSGAVELGDRLGLPVVADLRDPWALDEVRLYLSRAHRLAERRTMGRLLDRCALVIANTPDATSAIREAFPFLGEDRLATITNGFDATDFEGVATRQPDGRFRIVHTGYLHTSIAQAQGRNRTAKALLGGSLWSIDLFGRSHHYLLQALELLKLENPDLAATVDLALAGVLSQADLDLVEQSPVRDQVKLLGYLDHRAAIHEMVQADAVFLPMHDIPPGRRARIVPGKTYEYLASGRPILAAVPPGDARDFVSSVGAGVVTDPSDVAGIARAIEALAAGSPTPRRVPEGIERFERRELTRRLAGHLEKLDY